MITCLISVEYIIHIGISKNEFNCAPVWETMPIYFAMLTSNLHPYICILTFRNDLILSSFSMK